MLLLFSNFEECSFYGYGENPCMPGHTHTQTDYNNPLRTCARGLITVEQSKNVEQITRDSGGLRQVPAYVGILQPVAATIPTDFTSKLKNFNF